MKRGDIVNCSTQLRNRFIDEGIDSFDNYDLLELLLSLSISPPKAKALADTLLKEFCSVANIFEADYEDLLTIKNMDKQAAFHLCSIPQFCRRYLESKSNDLETLNTAADVAHFLLPKYIGRTKETASIICLDGRSRVKNFSIISEGSINSADISLHRIIEIISRHKAPAIVLAHNHPGGYARPSKEDIYTTEYIKNYLAKLDITLVDHIIIANNDFISLYDWLLINPE